MENRYEAFTLLVSSISRSIRRIKADAVAEYGLKSPHVTCIYYLYKQPGMTAAELCEQCDEDKAAISRSLFYLEESGFLTREVSIPNRRERGGAKHYRAALALTEKGAAVAHHIAERIEHVLEQVSCGVSDDDRKVLYRALEQIDRNLEQMGNRICDEN